MRFRGAAIVTLLLILASDTGGQSTGGAPKELCGHTWEAIDDDGKIHYKINVCENLKASDCGGRESSVCAHDIAKNTTQPVGNALVRSDNNVLVYDTSVSCPGSNHTVQSIINLVCGKSLGTPEFVKLDECVHYFEWRTFIACKKSTFKPIQEVPCYIFDADYKKHDLNPLIRTSGGYLVDDWDPDSDLYINICRTIGNSGGDTAVCPAASAACLVKDGKAYDIGHPKEPLASVVKERLVLHYETEAKPDFCNDHQPAVTITFICPTAGTEVTGPKLTANTNCRYEIEWVTENACHTEYLESDDCKLVSKERGISIDLTPLTEKSVSPYYVEDEKGDYVYYLNVCDKTSGGRCSSEMSSCQYKKVGTQSKGAGSYKNQTLRYSDGDITLTYPGGETCSSGFQRMTVINFECNETAVNDGKGLPEFDGEADCTYFFSWETKYACPKKKEDLCHVEGKKKHYNLFDLIRSPESSTAQNWEALNTSPSNKNRFYINVCHEVLQRGGAAGCDEDAAICAVESNKKKNLGKFLSAPKLVGDHIILEYTEGSECGENKKIQTSITLICSPGNLESPPILKHSDACLYEFEWNTAAACVLSKTEGENCRVSDSHAGFNFDLSPLSNQNESYSVVTDHYDFYINVCSNVTQDPCDANSGVCQVTKTKTEHWNLGVGSSKLSYYNGMIQLNYAGGTPYNDEKKTPRSSRFTFLCDRDADIGHPEYQKEDNYTYNFKWYTKYACPALPVECIVVDEQTNEQYDLSSLSKVHGVHFTNWYAMNERNEKRRKYYINVCRSLIPVTGCDPFTSVCQVEYTKVSDVTAERVENSNLGVASMKPVIEGSGKIILKYINGSTCIREGIATTYSSVIHLMCQKGATSKSPIFVSDAECIITFFWYTEAACPVVTETHGKDCKVENPNTGFVYNLESLRSDSGYVAKGNGKTYKLNICGPVNECGHVGDVPASGCELENNVASRPVQISQSLDLSSDFISLAYQGAIHEETGQGDMFTINFECNDDLYPGELSFKREEINSETHLYHTFFDFKTAMACSPSLVDCQVTDTAGNDYDLSDLSRDNEPWIAVDTSDSAKNRTFYLNVCKPLPYIRGCPGGVVGSCMKTTDKGFNLGFIQMSPQASADGSLTIVYMSGDKCRDNKHYSTRIIFQCDHNMGSPVFQEQNDCEYVFLWRTSEACPVVRAEGDNCQVEDPKYGHVYDLKPLGAKNVEVKDGEYLYQLRVCGEVTGSSCASKAPIGTTVSSCQVKGSIVKVAGFTNQKLIYEDGLIKINYTGGDLCHQKFNRTTLILFYCDKTEEQPVFMKETSDCVYMFQWRTPLACPPFKPIDCSFKDTNGNSYDLSSLSHYTENWEAEVLSSSNQKYRLNICKPLVLESGPASCPSGSAACLIDGTKAISLGEPSSSPRWDNGVAVLQYTNGDRCPNSLRNRTATIRFMCDLNQVVSKPQLITALEDCDYTFLWITPSACMLKKNTHDNCKVTNPATGHLFDLSSLSSKDGYVIKDRERSIKLNICSAVKPEFCDARAGVCVSEGGNHVNAGKAQSKLTYTDQVLTLVYEGGDVCKKDSSARHQSVFTFVCGSNPAAGSLPSFVSYSEDTCTWQFSWHTPLVCEREIKCSVQNGASNINLAPLMKHVGYYEVLQSDQEADSAVFYINLCEPLNEVVGVKCPPGSAACRVTANGDPVDIGRSTSPQIDLSTQTVSIKMNSTTQCDLNKQLNYSTIIIFHCNKGVDLGSPKFIQQADCNYVFEWGTPLVCPDEERLSGCSLMDQQLHYTFNLSGLSGQTYKTSSLNPYYIGVCSAAGNTPSGKCDGAVCLSSGNTDFSYGNPMAMKMEYRHLEDMLVLQYVGGDPCPPVTESGDVCVLPFTYKGKTYSTCISEDKHRPWCSISLDFEKNEKWDYCSTATERRSSTILFKCDERVGKGEPVLITDTKGCSATFEWKTQLACLPRKLDCKFIINHKSYDLRMLSSLTGSWSFASDGSKYYLNLCQRVNQGPSACSESASVCQEKNGRVQILGQVHTQQVSVKGDVVSVTYSSGDTCGKDKRFSTTIELTCANVTGKPVMKKYDPESCQYLITWETRAACAVVPKEVVMADGIIHGDNGANVNMSSIYIKSHNASGDVRAKEQYMYEIQLSGRENSVYETCNGASVCQVKINGQFTRAVGSSTKAKYYIDDDSLEAVFSSNSKCGKDTTKNATSTIFFRCSQAEGEGRPVFLHETADCQYLFSWYTTAVCSLVPESSGSTTDNPGGDHQNQYQGLSGRSQAVGAILSILLVILVACLVVLLLYKKERRETVMYKLTNCCRRSSTVSYKYTKINTEEEMDNETEWLMEEVSGNHSKPHHENGHVRSVKAGAFTSLHVDDLDSEDEVLTVPEVRIKSTRNQKRSEKPSLTTYPSGSDEKLIGIFNGGQEKTKESRSVQHNKEDKLNVASFHDDSDEDMLNV